jgi:peptide/nickel transport system permease protein
MRKGQIVLPGSILIALLLSILIGPVLVKTDPYQTNPAKQLQAPDNQHVLGTDLLGRDVLSRVLHGGRQTLSVACFSALFALGVGIPLGTFAGLTNRYIERGLFLLINSLLAIPGLIVAMVILTLMGRGSISLVVALGFSQIAPTAFLTRAAVQTARQSSFVAASFSLGAKRFYVISQHILPQIMPVLMTYLAVVFSYSILNSSALSFLGVGYDPGISDWGVMLAEGRTTFRAAPWIGLAPGLAITLVVWSINRLIDALWLPMHLHYS